MQERAGFYAAALGSLRFVKLALLGGILAPPPNLSSVWPHRCANKQPSSDFSTSLLLRTAPKPQSSHLANPRRHAAFRNLPRGVPDCDVRAPPAWLPDPRR